MRAVGFVPPKMSGEFIFVDLSNKCLHDGIKQEIQKPSNYVTPIQVARNCVTYLKCINMTSTNYAHREYCTDLETIYILIYIVCIVMT